ncbi:class I SAM-dependent methyltransferase [Halobacterium yunchengense]|uniref:class I SAM-dependent methyltransferase n=1 Tax=Halobacterium yunchengense TaxID=3108497 RepID=UPI00300996CE
MPPEPPAVRFESTESYYAAHRPGYGDAVVRYLVDRFDLAGERALDLGCGPGQLAVPLAAHASEVVGVDPNPAMLDHARERAGAAGRENVRWLAGSDADLAGLAADVGTVRLATMGRAFHWMDQGRTLDHVHALTDDAGGVAIVTDGEWLVRGTEPWQDAVYDAVTEHLEDVPERTGPVDYDDPWDELVADHGFRDVETRTFDLEREWTVEDAVGYVFSLSYCAPDDFGDEQAAFADDVRDRLADFDAPLSQTATVEVVAGRK